MCLPPPSTSPGPVGWHPKREVSAFFPCCMDPVQRNWPSTLNFCREASSQLIIWSWSQEKWIHFHFLGLPLKLLREDNYFLSSKYFLTSFSWKWQSGSAPGWQIQPWFDKCNSEHSPCFSVSFHGSEFSSAKWIVMYFGKSFFPSTSKPKEKRGGLRIISNQKTSLKMKTTFNLMSLIWVRKWRRPGLLMTLIQLIYLPQIDTGTVLDTKLRASSLGLAELVC